MCVCVFSGLYSVPLISLSLCQYHCPNSFHFFIRSDNLIGNVFLPCSFSEVSFYSWPHALHVNFRVILPSCVKNSVGILTGIALTVYVNLGRIYIFILSHEHSMYLFRSLLSLTCVIFSVEIISSFIRLILTP